MNKGPLPDGFCGMIMNKAQLAQKGLIVLPLLLDQSVEQIYVLVQAVTGVHLILPQQPIAQILLIPQRDESRTFGEALTPSRNYKQKADLFFLQQITAEKPILTIYLNGKKFRGLLDTGADATVIAQQFWPKSWPLEQAAFDLIGIGQAQSPLRSTSYITWQLEDGTQGIVKPFVVESLSINLWGRDILSHMSCVITTKNLSEDPNPGLEIMKKKGFIPGQGLGKNSQGRVEPIIPLEKHNKYGVGFDPHQNFS